MKLQQPLTIPTVTTPFTRASTATYVDVGGVWREAPVDMPRWGFDETDLKKPPILTVEAAASNLIRNPRAEGGSAGVSPTNWGLGAVGGITITPVARQTINGIEGMSYDLTGVGTDGNPAIIQFEAASVIPVVENEEITFSPHVALLSGSTAGLVFMGNSTNWQGPGSASFGANILADLAAAPQRFSTTFTGPPLVTYVLPRLAFVLGNGAALNCRIWIGWPQAVKGDVVSTPILPPVGAPATSTRAADVAPTFVTNVPEVAPAAYSGATTYAQGVMVSEANGVALDVYVSLQRTNLNHLPSASPLWWKKVNSTYPVYDAGATYAKGAVVIDPVAHLEYESANDANHGNSLTELNSLWWLERGATNMWAQFDGAVSTPTTAPDFVAVDMSLGTFFNAISLLEVDAAYLRYVITDPIEGVIRDVTISLTSPSGVDDWYDYFFTEIRRFTTASFDSLPLYPNARISISALDPGGIVSIGVAIVGLSTDLGGTEFGARMGIKNFSRKSIDDFGKTVIIRRGYSKKGNFTIWVPVGDQNAVFQLLADLKDTPVFWQGSDVVNYELTGIFGFYNDFEIVFQYYNYSILSVEIEGLI